MRPNAIPTLGRFTERYEGGIVENVQGRAWRKFLQAKDGNEKFDSLKRGIMFTWPEFSDQMSVVGDKIDWTLSRKYNPWLERCLRAFTNTTHATIRGDSVFRSVVLTGCAGAGKSHACGLYAVAWWLVAPESSIAILTSTTVGMIRSRIWPVITHYYETACDVLTGTFLNSPPYNIGHLVNSMLQIRADKTNAKNAIFAKAVAHGETQKAIHDLKGLHAERMLLIIDEANGTPEAICEVIANYRKGCRDLTVIIVGNPYARMDVHGRALTPEDGWPSIDESSLEWRTRPVPEWQLDAGIALRFDGRDSPNVKRGFNLFPYIYTLDNWQSAQTHLNTLAYWTQDRGMHPPEGFANTIFTEQLFARCLEGENEDVHFVFTGERTRLAFLDPAFGGDACVLQFGELGDASGQLCLQLTDVVEVPIDPNASAHDIDYQVARWVMNECKVRGVRPEHFGLDATGTGRGVGAILASEWSAGIQYMQWGQGATSRPSAQNDGRPAHEVYTTFVGEMWFAAREALEAGQVKGFSKLAMSQACSRMFDMRGKKYRLELKDEMKLRVRYSPDYMDVCVGILEVARRHGLVIAGAITKRIDREWEESVRSVQKERGDTGDALADEGGWANVDIHGDVVGVGE